MRAFVLIAECGSITSAADVLGSTQSAVSRQLATLEKLVGRRLDRRSHGGVALRPEGREPLPAQRVRDVVAGVQA